MAQPLAAFLAVVLALPSMAQPARMTHDEAKGVLARDFAKGTELQNLDFKGQAAPLALLLEQAKYVQAGREPGDEKETYIAFIRSVARRLGTPPGPAVELYGNRARPARVAVATDAELNARAAIALDVTRNPGFSTEKRARLSRDLLKTSDYLKQGLNGDANFIGGPKEGAIDLHATRPDTVATGPAVVSNGDRNMTRILPEVQPVKFVASETPPPAAGALGVLPSALSRTVNSLAELSAFIDVKRGASVAYEAISGVLEEGRMAVHHCYQFVKQALIDAGVIDAPNPQSTAIIGLRPDMASMFNTDVSKHPEILNRLGYRRARMSGLGNDPSEIPAGTIFIYGAHCAFAQYENAGHAELSVTRAEYENARASKPRFHIRPLGDDDVPACHYTCAGRSMPFLRTYGKGDNACLRMYVPVKNS
jgi:hypothetical protein